jgi:mannose-6-phosphate isomerase
MDISPDDIPIRVEKPWGYEIWFAWTDIYVGKIIHVNQGGKLSLQYHKCKDETSYLQSGRMLLTQGPTVEEISIREIGPGTNWRNLPGTIHTIEALEDSDVLEVSTPHLDDVIRLTDLYGRQGTNAP